LGLKVREGGLGFGLGFVPLYEVGQAKGMPYLVSGYVQGVTLADLLTARRPGKKTEGPLHETA
jgi:hypothetical protein